MHRDISPSNVLISRAGEVKLTDFGIARAIGGSHRTASGVIKGKIPYMPPEYIEGGSFDARGDLFALGVLIYELMHGRRPFDGESELDTLRKIAAGERRAFEAIASPALVACVDRLLQRQPADRFADAHALLDALPSVPVHQVRRRLAALVRARTSHTSLLAAPAVQQAQPAVPRTLALREREPLPPGSRAPGPRASAALAESATPTLGHTPQSARGARSLRPSRKALLALAASLVVLLGVLALAFSRGAVAPASAAAARPPRLPAWPGSSATAHDLAPAASNAAPAPASPEATSVPPDPQAGASTIRSRAGAPGSSTRAQRSAPPDDVRGGKRESAELYVVVYPFGDVWVDDKPAGQAPVALHLSPGSHEIAVGEGRVQSVRPSDCARRANTSRSAPSPIRSG